MAHSTSRLLLTVNTGSSSLKATLYPVEGSERPEASLSLERIGLSGSRMRTSLAQDDWHGRSLELPDHAAAIRALRTWLREHSEPVAIGHRVVHGGRDYSAPHVITDELIAALRRLVPIDPAHLPQALAAIETLGAAFPHVPQVACFDTAFHRTMPRVAQLYALPRKYVESGVIRYGFHGLSYEYVMDRLRTLDPTAADGKVIIAHLGNGASMAAVSAGRSIETTMGFSPTGGLVMGRRIGDIDPSVVLYLQREAGLSPDEVNRMLNEESGLFGVSGTSGDMQDLLVRAKDDTDAAEAVELFCYTARKFLGALATTLGGLETLVFTGGIGEHAAPVREQICDGLGFLGIALDPHANDAHEPIISNSTSAATVRIIPTDEDLMIARHTRQCITGGSGVLL